MPQLQPEPIYDTLRLNIELELGDPTEERIVITNSAVLFPELSLLLAKRKCLLTIEFRRFEDKTDWGFEMREIISVGRKRKFIA
ncbi:hypothetical protein TorRG33x02_209190 [Trema orientale]|uniref:Uncharacterized protein n=1 Tax=Trema orientale TaxID=63057 RepID=A0A2P5ECS9_TREOI|nr:hypothetical protein TorRG33x02_209190 [Trema orientale]